MQTFSQLPHALAAWSEIEALVAGKEPAVFLDYDGTLTPIVSRPELARLGAGTRDAVAELAARCPVAVVSGRDRCDVERLVALDGVIYAGSHGFDIAGPGGLRREHPEGVACLPELDAAVGELERRLDAVAGVQIERKRFAIAIHFRNVENAHLDRVEPAVDEVLGRHPRLCKTHGKKIYELRPDVDWHKGRTVRWLLRALDLEGPAVVPFYLGDDVTDEDAFRHLPPRGVAVAVGDRPGPTHARYRLDDPGQVERFLGRLTAHLRAAARH